MTSRFSKGVLPIPTCTAYLTYTVIADSVHRPRIATYTTNTGQE